MDFLFGSASIGIGFCECCQVEDYIISATVASYKFSYASLMFLVLTLLVKKNGV